VIASRLILMASRFGAFFEESVVFSSGHRSPGCLFPMSGFRLRPKWELLDTVGGFVATESQSTSNPDVFSLRRSRSENRDLTVKDGSEASIGRLGERSGWAGAV